jgi:hypothetical protein
VLKRKQHATEFEPKVALKGEATVQALASRCDGHLLPTMHFYMHERRRGSSNGNLRLMPTQQKPKTIVAEIFENDL